MIDPKWIDALRLPVKVTISLTVACAVLLVLNWEQIVDLDQVVVHGKSITLIVFAVSMVFVVVEVADSVIVSPIREKKKINAISTRRLIRRAEEKEEQAIKRSATLASIDHLSAEELHYVAKCLHEGTPTFYTYAYSPPVAMLVSKGLVWTSGTQHNQDHYPFSIRDYVWDELLKRKSELIAADAANKAKEAAIRRR